MAGVAWNVIWVKRLGVEIPIDRKFNYQGSDRRQLVYTTRTFSIVFTFFKNVLQKFDSEYWTTHVGLDGYIYLLFQRQIMKLCLFFSVVSIIVSIPINAFNGDTENWFERTTLSNKTLTDSSSWAHVSLVILFSLAAFYVILGIKEEVKSQYIKIFRLKCRQQDHEWLKTRTLYVRGLLPIDRKGEMLKNMINEFLHPHGGKVLQLTVIPDFQDLFELELAKKNLDDQQQLLQANRVLNTCFRLSDEKYTRKRRDLDQKIEDEIIKPFLNSGHAFLCVDSIQSMERCLDHFQIGPFDGVKILFTQLGEKLKECFTLTRRRTIRTQSTFNRFNDVDIDFARGGYGDSMHILLNFAMDPIDICWGNIGGTRGLYIFRRIILAGISVLVILFLSTPAVSFIPNHQAMVSALKVIDIMKFLDFEWANDIAGGHLIKTYVPPLIIITINMILLILIDFTAQWERHFSYSKYQFSVFNKSVFYLNMNMLVIPALTLTTAESIFKVIGNKGWNLTEILGDFYISESGIFFVSLLIQNATLSSSFYILRMGDIIQAYFSPWLAHYKRKYLNDSQPWRKKEGNLFSYGYYYAQLITVFAIVMLFSSTVPLVTLAGAFYFMLRHLVDSFNLLTVHRKELESSSQMIKQILLSAMIFILLYQACMIAFFYIKHKLAESAVLVIFFFLSCIVTYFTHEKLFDTSKMDLKDLGEVYDKTNFTEGNYEDWRADYCHPLMLQSAHHTGASVGVEVRNFDDYNQFVSDHDARGVMYVNQQSRPSIRGRPSVHVAHNQFNIVHVYNSTIPQMDSAREGGDASREPTSNISSAAQFQGIPQRPEIVEEESKEESQKGEGRGTTEANNLGDQVEEKKNEFQV